MIEFFSVKEHQLFAILFALMLVLIWMRLNTAFWVERKEMADWVEALTVCFAKNDFSCIPKGVRLKGIYKRLKMLEKAGIDADVHYDKETLYVSNGNGKKWQFNIY